jgi:CheY-like chemotaxis protein
MMSSYRVLIVDDQHEVRRMLAASLRTLGSQFDVLEVPSGEEALLISSRLPLDLVVADVRLPGMSGLELVARLQKRAPPISTILLTGVEEPRLRRQVAEAGADAFFYKPVEMADFLDAVERCLGLVKEAFPLPPVAEEPVASKEHKTIPLASLAKETQPSAAPPPVPTQPMAKAETLPERLALLRRQLNAVSVSLLNEAGRSAAEAGKLPDITPGTALIPVLMSAFSAGQKVARSLGREKSPDNLLCFGGGRFHLCMAPVGATYALLIVSLDPFTPARLSEIGQAVRPAAEDLLHILERMGVELEPRPEAPPPPVELPVDVTVDPATRASVDALFGQAVKAATPISDADRFWDAVAESQELDGASSQEALSYEQARELGLAPEEDA